MVKSGNSCIDEILLEWLPELQCHNVIVTATIWQEIDWHNVFICWHQESYMYTHTMVRKATTPGGGGQLVTRLCLCFYFCIRTNTDST